MTVDILSSIKGAQPSEAVNKLFDVIKNAQPTNNNSDLKQMIRDVVRDTVRDVVKEELKNSGLLSESTQKANETLSLRVGKHIFEGKVTKIKKVKQ